MGSLFEMTASNCLIAWPCCACGSLENVELLQGQFSVEDGDRFQLRAYQGSLQSVDHRGGICIAIERHYYHAGWLTDFTPLALGGGK